MNHFSFQIRFCHLSVTEILTDLAFKVLTAQLYFLLSPCCLDLCVDLAACFMLLSLVFFFPNSLFVHEALECSGKFIFMKRKLNFNGFIT